MKKCPKCGSPDTAAYLYGMPAFSEALEKDIARKRVILEGCCVSDHDPKYRCNVCHKNFGYPPVVKHKNGQRDYLEETRTIAFSVGGFFDGYTEIDIGPGKMGTAPAVLDLLKRHPCRDEAFAERLREMVFSHRQYDRSGVLPLDGLLSTKACKDKEFLSELRQIAHDNGRQEDVCMVKATHSISGVSFEYPLTDKRFAALLDRLYNGIHLLEWKRRYYNNGILDGTQWEIRITCFDGSNLNCYGSNEYPPYYKEMLSAFRPFAKKAGLELRG